jgi:DNA replication and repair protein RecF
VTSAHDALVGAAATDPEPGAAVTLHYLSTSGDDLVAALAAARADDLRRAVSTVGPHRDDVEIRLGGRPARTQASQGEQRSLALSLRLAVHGLVAERRGATPILLLDDVFSELDPGRSRALVHQLPAGQSLLTTATPLPPDVRVDREVDVAALGTRG